MANPEYTAVDPEVRQLISRAEEIFATAPDMSAEDLDDEHRIKHTDFKISERSVANDHAGMQLNLVGKTARITTSTGSVKFTTYADKPFKESLVDYEAFYQERLHATYPDITRYYKLEASRLFEIGDHPAETHLELVKKIGEGAMRTLHVRYALHRRTTDGGTLVQAGALVAGKPTPVTHYETLYNTEGNSVPTEDDARGYAQSKLPRDPAFPLDAPIGINQLKIMLG